MFQEPIAEISMKKFDDWWLDVATNVVITWTPISVPWRRTPEDLLSNQQGLLGPAAVAWIDRG